MSDHLRCDRCRQVTEVTYLHRVPGTGLRLCYSCKVRHDNLQVRLQADRAARPAQYFRTMDMPAQPAKETHAEHMTRVGTTNCSAMTMGFGGRCLSCGWQQGEAR